MFCTCAIVWGTAPCSSLDSCRRSGLAMCLSLDVLPTDCGLECWPCCKPERAGSLLGPFSPICFDLYVQGCVHTCTCMLYTCMWCGCTCHLFYWYIGTAYTCSSKPLWLWGDQFTYVCTCANFCCVAYSVIGGHSCQHRYFISSPIWHL